MSRGETRRLMVEARTLLRRAEGNLGGNEAARDALTLAREAIDMALKLEAKP
jgi:hypothetical protein